MFSSWTNHYANGADVLKNTGIEYLGPGWYSNPDVGIDCAVITVTGGGWLRVDVYSDDPRPDFVRLLDLPVRSGEMQVFAK